MTRLDFHYPKQKVQTDGINQRLRAIMQKEAPNHPKGKIGTVRGFLARLRGIIERIARN